MSERALEMKIGLFVLTGIVIFCGMLVMVEADLLRETYAVTAVLNDATGLKPGVPVRLGGVDIGSVDTILLPTTDLAAVELKLAIRKEVGIKKAANLFVATQGLLGERYLEFQLVTEKGECIPKDGTARVVGIVPPTLSKLTETASQLIVNINKIFEAPDFEANIKATAENAREVSRKSSEFMDEAKSFMTRLDEFVVHGEDVLVEFKQAGEKAGKAIDTADSEVAKIGETANNTLLGLQQNSVQLHESLDVLVGILRRVDEGQGTVGQLVRNAEIFDRTSELLEQLSVTVFNLNRTIEYLYQNPSDLFWGKSESDEEDSLARARARKAEELPEHLRLKDEFSILEARRRKP
ncbi:MAG: MlaD family protein [Planctomycetota bacterium]|nr:MlaD family protein [Planctomycetota bacterium]